MVATTLQEEVKLRRRDGAAIPSRYKSDKAKTFSPPDTVISQQRGSPGLTALVEAALTTNELHAPSFVLPLI